VNAQGHIALWLAGMLRVLAVDPGGEAQATVGMEGV
jgi:hypothetical protein